MLTYVACLVHATIHMLFGARGAASVISSAATEKSSNDNFAQFVAGVTLALAQPNR